MSRRPGESAAEWYERAIVNHSVASTQREAFPWSSNTNLAAHDAIGQRVSEAATDLELAKQAFRAERGTDTPSDPA